MYIPPICLNDLVPDRWKGPKFFLENGNHFRVAPSLMHRIPRTQSSPESFQKLIKDRLKKSDAASRLIDPVNNGRRTKENLINATLAIREVNSGL